MSIVCKRFGVGTLIGIRNLQESELNFVVEEPERSYVLEVDPGDVLDFDPHWGGERIPVLDRFFQRAGSLEGIRRP